MKTRRFLVLLLVVVLAVTMLSPVAYAAKKKKKTYYQIFIDRATNVMTVFTRKEDQPGWDIAWSDKCSTGNPYWPTQSGRFLVIKRKSSIRFDGEKHKYALFFGPHVRMMISAHPKFSKKDYRYLGGQCTMGDVWLSSSRAKWLYKKIPNGTEVYIF